MSRLTLVTGTAIKTEEGFFYIKNTTRVKIPNNKVLKSWNFPRVVKVSEADVAHYPVMGLLPYRDGSLLWCISDGRYYLITGGKRLQVTDPQMLKDHKLSFKDAFIVSKKEIEAHAEVVA